MTARLAKRKGYTLLEILMVVAIVAVLAALLMVGLLKARSAADRVTTVNNLYNIGHGLQSHHSVNKAFPTEGAADSPSLYEAILPFVDAANATPTTPVKIFLSPSRRSVEVGPKRDFVYGASHASGAAGPAIFDSPNPISKGNISEGGKSIAETALLSMAWMAPPTYTSGDATDAGWAQKMNSRMDLTGIKKDIDPNGNTNVMGGPYESGVPTLFADNHISMMPYSTSQENWSYYWAYNTSLTKACDEWVPATSQKKDCGGRCGAGCTCGCTASGANADGGNPYDANDILDMLRDKAENGYLSKEEKELLDRLSKDDAKKYNDRLNKEKADKEKSIREKAERGEQLTKDEQDYYDKYTNDKKKKQANDEANKKKNEAIEKGKRGETLNEEEQKHYDNYQKSEADKAKKAQEAADKKKWQNETMEKAKNGEQLTPDEQKYYDQNRPKTPEEQAAYDQKQQEQKAQNEAKAKEKEEAYQKDLQNRLNSFVDNLPKCDLDGNPIP